MSIATKTGDNGTTGLLFGRRLSKAAPRIAANGAVDELNAALGVARAFSEEPMITEAIFSIQLELVDLMGEIAVLPEDHAKFREKGFRSITPEMVARLTALIDDLEQSHQITFKHWATPGATKASAFLDQARTACRRAEREIISFQETGAEVNPEIIRYLNRLSDLCWLYARFVETKAGV